MTYIINIWQYSDSDGVSCIWRGTDRKSFFKEIQKAVLKYGSVKGIGRIIDYSDYTIFSFASRPVGYNAWLRMEFCKKPLSVKYVKVTKGAKYG